MSIQKLNLLIRLKKTKSFTLIELIIVTAIIAIISLSLCRALSIGLKVWETSRLLSAEEDIMIFLDKISMDLRNAVDFSLFEFKGKPNIIRIPTVVSVPLGRSDGDGVYVYTTQIGIVEYGFDGLNQSIYQRKAHYGQAVNNEFDKKRFLANRIKGLSFKYFDRNKNGLTSKKLGQKRLPAAVEISIQYQDTHGHLQTLKRLINLPIKL